jgi:methyl-accepting chemotaxis protein
MPAFNLSLRITHKIAAIGLMGIAGLAAVGGIYVLGNSAQETHRTVAADARAISDGTNRLFVDLLEARRAEKDFLLRNEEKYAERHATLAKAIASDFDTLSSQIRSAGLSDLDAKITSVRAGFGGYLKHFTGVVEAKRKLGLDEGSGLEGALRKSVHAIETKLKDFDEPRLAVTMLMMRRHEKDFMLRRDPKYGGDMRKRGAEFAAGLAAATIPAAARDDIARMLEAYQRDFFAWMQGAEMLAAEQKATSEAYAKIEPLIETILQSVAQVRIDAEAADTTSRAATTLQMQTAIAFVILAVAALAFLIGRAVSRPLTSLARAMRLLADGQFDVALPGLGRRDEIGAIAQAVETFKVKAVEKAQREAQEKEAEARRPPQHAVPRCTASPITSRSPSAALSRPSRPPRRSWRPQPALSPRPRRIPSICPERSRPHRSRHRPTSSRSRPLPSR